MKNIELGITDAFIDEDLTWKEREIRGALRERVTGKTANTGYMKMWVDGREYR